MPYPGEISRSRAERKTPAEGHSLSFGEFLNGVIPESAIHTIQTTFLPPLLSLMNEGNVSAYFRGSHVPIAFAPENIKKEMPSQNREFTRLMSHILTRIPEIGRVLNISPGIFMQNIDLDIEATSENHMRQIATKLGSSIPGIQMNQIHPSLIQLTLPGIPEFFVNVTNPTTSKPEQASLFAIGTSSDPFLSAHVYHGKVYDKRFAVSELLDAEKAYLSGKDSKGAQVIVNKSDFKRLYSIKPDEVFVDPALSMGEQLAKLARQARSLGLTFGTDKMRTLLNNKNNTKDIKEVIFKTVELTKSVDHPFDRTTLIGNFLALFLNNPAAFHMFVRMRPLAFAACRFLTLGPLFKTQRDTFVNNVGRNDISDVISYIADAGIIQDEHTISSLGAPDDEPLRPLKAVVSDVYAQLESLVPGIDTYFGEVMKEIDSYYTISHIKELLGLLMLFDPWDIANNRAFPIDPTHIFPNPIQKKYNAHGNRAG